MVICGLQGPIVTTVRSILTPHPLKELRVKNTYITHKEIKAAQVRPRAMLLVSHNASASSAVCAPHGPSVEQITVQTQHPSTTPCEAKDPLATCMWTAVCRRICERLRALSTHAST